MWKILFFEALSAVIANKSRSLLTILGIVIGIASVLTVIAAGNGGRESINREFEGLSPRALDIYPNYYLSRINPSYKRELITDQDLRDLEEYVQEIEFIAPVRNTRATIKTKDKTKQLTVMGTTNNYIHFIEFKLTAGRLVTAREVETQAKVVIVGSAIAEEFFPGRKAVGEYITILGTPMLIIGVLEKKEKVSAISFSDMEDQFNNAIVVPVGIFRRFWGNIGGYNSVKANAKTIADIPRAKEHILQILARSHGKWDNFHNKFEVSSMNEQLQMINNSINTVTWGVAAIAGIALLVAATGIMNIMLISVKERTREIGIRKALGARQYHIMLQFLMETILLCGTGGILGLGLAFLASWLIGIFTQWQNVIDPATCIFALLLAMLTGLLSGLYPAGKAARLPPQEALRYE